MRRRPKEDKPFKNTRDIQILKAVELSRKTPKPLNTNTKKTIGEEE